MLYSKVRTSEGDLFDRFTSKKGKHTHKCRARRMFCCWSVLRFLVNALLCHLICCLDAAERHTKNWLHTVSHLNVFSLENSFNIFPSEILFLFIFSCIKSSIVLKTAEILAKMSKIHTQKMENETIPVEHHVSV